MRYLLDTNSCVAFLRDRNSTVGRRLTSVRYSDVVLCAVVKAELAQRGLPIGPNDLMIAAIALAYDATLVTHNTGEFSRVQDLRLEDWEQPA